jgi:hypothetical protein
VLTQSGTCSASESVINRLRRIDLEVIQIGGKPHGFTAKDDCGNSYFQMDFNGLNAKSFGEYADGFSPGQQWADAMRLFGVGQRQSRFERSHQADAGCGTELSGDRAVPGGRDGEYAVCYRSW